MCIRDRPRALLREIGDYVELPSAGTCCGGAGTYSMLQPTMSQACLLYTSDAADERSSGDLGGRRIIKNKNDIRCEEKCIIIK